MLNIFKQEPISSLLRYITRHDWVLVAKCIASETIQLRDEKAAKGLYILLMENGAPIQIFPNLIKLWPEFYESLLYKPSLSLDAVAAVPTEFSLEKILMNVIKLNPHLMYDDDFCCSLFTYALSEKFSVDFLMYLLKEGINTSCVFMKDKHPYHLAFEENFKNDNNALSEEKALLLLQWSSKIFYLDEDTENPNFSVLEETYAPVSPLVKKVHDVYQDEKSKFTAFLSTAAVRKTEPVSLFNAYDFYIGSEDIFAALKNQQWSKLENILDALEFGDNDRYLLHFAVYYDAPPATLLHILKFLPCSLTAKHNGLIPLMVSFKFRKPLVISTILSTIFNGISCHIPDQNNMYALHYAILYTSSKELFITIDEQFPRAKHACCLYPYLGCALTLALREDALASEDMISILFNAWPSEHLEFLFEKMKCSNPLLLAMVSSVVSQKKAMYLLSLDRHLTLSKCMSKNILFCAISAGFSLENLKIILDLDTALFYCGRLNLVSALHLMCSDQRAKTKSGQDIIVELFNRRPSSATTPDADGNLPIHFLIDKYGINHDSVRRFGMAIYENAAVNMNVKCKCPHPTNSRINIRVPSTSTRDEITLVIEQDVATTAHLKDVIALDPNNWPPVKVNPIIRCFCEENWDKALSIMDGKNGLCGVVGYGQYALYFALFYNAPVHIINKIITLRKECAYVRWDNQLPLQFGIKYKCNTNSLLECVRLEPKLLELKNGFDMMPLHEAALYNCHKTLLNVIMDLFPSAIHYAARKMYFPLTLSLEEESTSTLETTLSLFFATSDTKVANIEGNIQTTALYAAIHAVHNICWIKLAHMIKSDKKYLPIDLLLSVGAPHVIIKAMIESNPDLLKKKYLANSSLLHFALTASRKEDYEANISILLDLQPESVMANNKRGEQPFNMVNDILGPDHHLTKRIFDLGIEQFNDEAPKKSPMDKKKKNKKAKSPQVKPAAEIDTCEEEKVTLNENIGICSAFAAIDIDAPQIAAPRQDSPKQKFFKPKARPSPVIIPAPPQVKIENPISVLPAMVSVKKKIEKTVVSLPAEMDYVAIEQCLLHGLISEADVSPDVLHEIALKKSLVESISLNVLINEKEEEKQINRALLLADVEQDCQDLFADIDQEREKMMDDDYVTDLSCIICFERKMDTVFFPCNHLCVCSNCAAAVTESATPHCPKCRVAISNFIKIYV